MTPALQKVVEAMAVEFQRQTHETGGVMACSPDGEYAFVGSRFDLEKVARAGLEAMDVEAMARAMHEYVRALPVKPGATWALGPWSFEWRSPEFMEAVGAEEWISEQVGSARAALDAILKEMP